jgi:hypothetical protein
VCFFALCLSFATFTQLGSRAIRSLRIGMALALRLEPFDGDQDQGVFDSRAVLVDFASRTGPHATDACDSSVVMLFSSGGARCVGVDLSWPQRAGFAVDRDSVRFHRVSVPLVLLNGIFAGFGMRIQAMFWTIGWCCLGLALTASQPGCRC